MSGVGARRKGPKTLPKLPASAFSSPPPSNASDKFPIPRSPTNILPATVVDALVYVGDKGLQGWQTETGQVISGGRVGGVVALVDDIKSIDPSLTSGNTSVPVISIMVPLDLENGVPSPEPAILKESKVRISTTTTFKGASSKQAEGIKWAVERGLIVNVVVQIDLNSGESGWDVLEDLISNSVSVSDAGNKGAIVLSNILPPPRTLSVPLVQLLTHPSYLTYQARIAALSLFPATYIQFLPPDWQAATPETPPQPGSLLSPAIASPISPDATPIVQDSKEKREWKRRIKMYVSPVLEAFGYERIIYGSKPYSSASTHAGHWYELARESFAELVVDQEIVDGVFGGNAKQLYGN